MSEMGPIVVFLEHRQGALREISSEMLSKADALARSLSLPLKAVYIGPPGPAFLQGVGARADEVLAFCGEGLPDFDPDLSKEILLRVLGETGPAMLLMAHTAWGMGLAPALSIRSGLPLVTDCVGIDLEGDRPRLTRQLYAGKVMARVLPAESPSCLLTVRQGAFPVPEGPGEPRKGTLRVLPLPPDIPASRSRFVEYLDTGAGDVDITQAKLLVSIGRGIGSPEAIPRIQDLARRLNGTLSCSRPIVDKNWLPRCHQVGTSGKTVKPRVYLALGISGAFQHVAGMSGANTVVAVNKDKKAPIFRVAHYGVVEDLFKIVEALSEKIR